MASASKTPNLNLPQWVDTEKPERTDFNAAFDSIDDHLADNVHIGNNPQAKASSATNQSIADSTFTFLTFSSEEFDNDNMLDIATYNNRLTCKTAGNYLMVAYVSLGSNSAGIRVLNIRLNGTSTPSSEVKNSPSLTSVAHSIINSAILKLNVGDYIQAQVYQNSGGAINAQTRYLSIIKVG